MQDLSIQALKKLHTLKIPKINCAVGSIKVPGSKSISNRALLIASICETPTKIYGILRSDDTKVMLDALQKLGVKIDITQDYIFVEGQKYFTVKKSELFMGNAGTAMRPLTAMLCFMNGEYILSGIARMHERPIGDLVESLKQIGANIEYLNNEGYPPIKIKPSNIDTSKPIIIKANTSSQFLSSLIIALPSLSQDKDIIVNIDGDIISRPYVELTLKLISQFGVDIIDNGNSFTIKANSEYSSNGSFEVEGDASSASYMIACGILGGKVCIENVGSSSIQGDVDFVKACQMMGANIKLETNSITAFKSNLHGAEIDCLKIPDAGMTLAILALFASSPTKLFNIASWKVKETDRIEAMHTELEKLGAKVESDNNSITIYPPNEWIQNQSIDTYDDHRIAMCFSLCAFSEHLEGITINEPACIAKTYPNYFEDLFRLVSS